MPPSSLSGFVYDDVDNDGIKEPGEAGIAGVTVKLGGSATATTTTNANGLYTFSGLAAGTYTITETQPAGYTDGKDTIGSQGGTVGSDTFTGIVLGAGAVGSNYNFGEHAPPVATIKVVKSSTTTLITNAGQVVPYTFTVTNTGNIALTSIKVTDPKCSTSITRTGGDTNGDNKLQTTETWTYTCNRTVTQAEFVPGGTLTNTVTADSTESAPATASLNIPITPNHAPVANADSYTTKKNTALTVPPRRSS